MLCASLGKGWSLNKWQTFNTANTSIILTNIRMYSSMPQFYTSKPLFTKSTLYQHRFLESLTFKHWKRQLLYIMIYQLKSVFRPQAFLESGPFAAFRSKKVRQPCTHYTQSIPLPPLARNPPLDWGVRAETAASVGSRRLGDSTPSSENTYQTVCS